MRLRIALFVLAGITLAGGPARAGASRTYEDPRFNACFGQNRAEISEDALAEIYAAALKDPHTHMKTPEVHCLHRAYLLMTELYKKGYKARLLHVKTATTLIGLVNFNSSTPNSFVDYRGKHWVVSVNVVGNNGKTKREILDPQFMNSPLAYADYFGKTVGRSCHPGKALGPGDCTYEEIRPDSFALRKLEAWYDFKADPATQLNGCTWPLEAKIREKVEEINRWTETTAKPIPPGILALKDPEKMLKALVRATEQRTPAGIGAF